MFEVHLQTYSPLHPLLRVQFIYFVQITTGLCDIHGALERRRSGSGGTRELDRRY